MSSRIKDNTCSECHKKFSSVWTLQRHFNEKHSDYRFVRDCPKKGCARQFNRKFFLVQHLRRQHGVAHLDAKQQANNVNTRCVSTQDIDKNRYNIIKVEDYSDISDDDFDFGDIIGHQVEEKPQSVNSFENFSIFANEESGLSDVDDQLKELQEEMNENDTKADENICNSDSDTASENSSKNSNDSDAEVISISDEECETKTTTVTLTLIRKEIKHSDGTIETTRNSIISYSKGLEMTRQDFEFVARDIISEIPEHFKKENKRFMTTENV